VYDLYRREGFDMNDKDDAVRAIGCTCLAKADDGEPFSVKNMIVRWRKPSGEYTLGQQGNYVVRVNC
jgi:hypothetical protein